MSDFPRPIKPLPDFAAVEDTEYWNLREVHPNFYVGGMCSALMPGFDTVVAFDGYEGDPAYAKFRKVAYLFFDDGETFPPQYLQSAYLSFVGAQGRPVLFHCAMGISRSVSAVYAVLRLLGLSHEEAFTRARHPTRNPMPKTFNAARSWAEAQLSAKSRR